MPKKILALVFVVFSMASCASWFTSSQENPDSPSVGGRQDSSDMLFGQAESVSPGAQKQQASAIVKAANASEPASSNAMK